jgi:hypothetical protein
VIVLCHPAQQTFNSTRTRWKQQPHPTSSAVSASSNIEEVYNASVALLLLSITPPLYALRETSLYSDACKSCILHSQLMKTEGSFLVTNNNNSRVLFSCLTTVSNQSDASELRHNLAVFLSYWLAFFFLSFAWTE